MDSNFVKQRENKIPVFTAVLTTLVAVLALTLGGLLVYYYVPGGSVPSAEFDPPSVQTPTETIPEEPAETEPEPTWLATATGMATGVLCKQSYTDPYNATMAEWTVATMGDAVLTNAQLQIWYLSEVCAYRAGNREIAPDFSRPLDCQHCPLGDGTLSWQHYFLEQAIKDWQAQQAMLYRSRQPQIIPEEAYKPNETDDLHGKYVDPSLPVNDFLYADKDCYTPNEMHQAYLDALEEQLETLAAELGFRDLADYVQQTFGASLKAEDLVAAAREYNTSYFYFTECSYGIDPTQEEAEAYLSAHESQLGKDAVPMVDFRHLLLIPEDAQVGEDGRVTATEEQWKKCSDTASQLLRSWRGDYQTTRNAESNFARLANQQSADGGSQINGGYYQQICQGQMIDALDQWLFDDSRKAGDVDIVRSELGYHLVYLSKSYSSGLTAAREALIRQQEEDLWKECCEAVSGRVDYSAASLWVDTTAKAIGLEDVLYPDVAHERFPSAIVYFQQDYTYSRYGSSYVGQGGCGITTMAMLCTYMADELYTPHMLAAAYPYYHVENGTNGDIFRFATADMGFYLDHTTSRMEEVIEALENDQRVISLQVKGVFTSGGHYLLLQRYYPESDTFQVRDSNIYNYGKLRGHIVDYFTRADILSGNTNFWIMQQKIRRIPACDRCGGEMEQQAPELLLNGAYTCEKCTKALSRRNNFLDISKTLL